MTQISPENGAPGSAAPTHGVSGHNNDTNGHLNGSNGYTNGHTNGTGGANGHANGTNGANGPHVNGSSHAYSDGHANGANGHQPNSESHTGGPRTNPSHGSSFEPIAICGMACRLPGGIASPQELWDFLIEGRDGRIRVPETRFNIDGFYSPVKRPGTTNTQYGYFLDESVDLGGLDTSFFSMSRAEVEWLDPQQRMMLEVARESLDDAGEVNWKGSNTGVYIGSFGQDWYDILNRDPLRHSLYSVITSHDFMISERVSHELDLHGPSMTIRTACSSALVSLNEACMAIAKGDCESAIVGGANLILAPDLVTRLSDQGILSPDGECRTFSANANGYARGEAIVSVYIKSLSAALRDGNPIRSVISGSAANFDGKTNPLTMPSATAQEALIKRAYQVAGISDLSRTALFECHGTGTATGDPIETEAIASVFGENGIIIGAVKPNVGHSEGASGLTALLKATLALEHRTIPPNIKYSPPNPRIPFKSAKLQIPEQPMPWPEHRDERISINSFGVGGSNAHVIVESTTSYLASRQGIELEKSEASREPQLLLFSANTAQSLRDMIQNYQTLLSRGSVNVADVAYTLANRRVHLLHRSFAVATPEKFEVAGTLSSPVAEHVKPSLVMVFTGQGAAWPRAGRELLRSNRIFHHTIQSLDKHLKSLGDVAPSWSLEEEFLKPARTSRVYEAEFSQPLCTALQLALIDTLAAVGIKPAAVVGHSSGEIAAAYASGALTAEEAITVAFHRGATAKGQTERGGMVAIGLGWEETQKYLVPGVVTACDNSPSSVTISGDAEKLEDVVANIKQAFPDVPATTLKVEKAYHSHHMVALGKHYHQDMAKSGVVGKAPELPFFSSVTGQRLGSTKCDQLGPKYWQANLERPVLFNSAVSRILQCPELENPVFFELGPHSALAGPLRQILASAASKAPYVSSLVRRQDSVENLLQAVGKLYASRVTVDFEALMPGGSCAVDLPHYPWDHQRRYWFESRVAREWRGRQYPEHNLLGSKLTESTDLEPIWRNLLQVRTTPWIQDHKIGETIVFPFAGYVAMAAEAARQATGIEDGVSFRNVVVSTAMVVDEDAATEVVTTMRRYRLTDNLDSEWWEFAIYAHNGHVWTKHCSGEVRGQCSEPPSSEETEIKKELPRKVDVPRWYDAARRQGLTYGPTFTTMENLRASTSLPYQATAKMQNNKWEDKAQYFLHPVVLDTFFQLESSSNYHGVGHAYRRLVLSGVESMTIWRCTEDDLQMSITTERTAKGCVGTGSITSGSKTYLRISGSHASNFEEGEVKDDTTVPITARCEWVPHVDFKDASKLIELSKDEESARQLLSQLVKQSTAVAMALVKDVEVQAPHLFKYKEWLSQQGPPESEVSDVAAATQKIDSLVMQLEGTPVAPASAAIAAVLNDIEAILKGKKSGFEVLNSNGNLDSLLGLLRGQNDSKYLRCLGTSKPNLRVLEVGAGLGEKTTGIINSLTRADGRPLYSQYVFADPSSGMINTAKERLKALPNVEFATFTLDESMAHQGFEGRQFDLIIAAGIANSSSNILKSLENLRGLLSPTGRLLLEEPQPGLPWTTFTLGTMPNWWDRHADGREAEPFVGLDRWKKELSAAGFADVNPLEANSEHSANNVIIARSQPQRVPPKKITVLCNGTDLPETRLVIKELEARGYEVHHCSLEEAPPHNEDVLALLEEEGSFFEDIGDEAFGQFKSFIGNLGGSSGLLWVTRLSSIGCTEPHYAQAIGLARSLRSETGADIATCEMEKITSPAGAIALADVLARFQTREGDDVLGPDNEYAIYDGETLVNRIFPFSLDQELLVSDASDEACVSIAQPGRLNTLTWSSQSATTPGEDEVEVEIHASGLNFRDVLVGMQIIPGLETPRFGYEAAGIVRRVGARVTSLCVGDRVVTMGSNTFATVVTGPALLCVKLPDSLSFVDASCIPTVFLTAVYGLIDLGHLSKGQSVLIHSGCGGVGLSAIQVARMVGAEIYTTVGSDEKIQYLMDTFGIPRKRIFNSRNTSFAEDLLHETGGKGVDVALNSLSGELLHATWKCVAKFGTMVEIGKRDLLENARLDMHHFLANRSYCCLDMDQMRIERPEICNRLLRSTMETFEKGIFTPIRVDRVFGAPAVLDAFRYMQQGKHIGKIVLEIRDKAGKSLVDHCDSDKTASLQLDGAASYLLIGGLGGLGRSISVWMVEHGARNLTFLSRSAGSGTHDAEFVKEVESMGCTVQLVRGDVACPEDVSRAVDGAIAPLKGIVQMSMVLRDQMFDGMSLENWNAVTRPKVQGTWNLHNVTSSRKLDLDFFVLFSSLSGVIGQIGQANYASANTFLDAFVQYRAGLNLPCTAIDLGAMEGIGYLSENQELLRKMQGTGWRAVQEVELLRGLELAMMAPSTRRQRGQNAVATDAFVLGFAPTIPLSSPESSARLRKDPRMAVYHNISGGGSSSKASSTNDGLRSILAGLKKDPSSLKSSDTVAILATEIGKRLFSLILAGDKEVDITMGTADMGLDSLVAVELRGWWKINFGFDISTLEMLSMGTLEALGKRAADGLASLYGT